MVKNIDYELKLETLKSTIESLVEEHNKIIMNIGICASYLGVVSGDYGDYVLDTALYAPHAWFVMKSKDTDENNGWYSSSSCSY
jgi:hypothetical protein